MRYRILYNGDHWRIQTKPRWWPFWSWHREHRGDWEMRYSLIPEFASDIAARERVTLLQHDEEARAKYNAPFTLSIEL